MIPSRILFATQNQGKQRELQAILADLGVILVLPSEVGLGDFDVEETGATLEDNARLKAQAFAEASSMVCIADDSGLEVTALDGQPGVFSKRFGKDDAERISKLLGLLKGKNDRTAQFRSVLCYVDVAAGISQVAEGIVTGQIANEPRGSGGFGYDPIFVPDGYDQTFAELGAEVKNTISHRARAGAELKKWLMRFELD